MRFLKLVALCTLLFFACVALAQTTSTGDISGAVKDPSGAAISGATVTITNKDRGAVARTVKTDASGTYVAPLLPVGHYKIDVESSGFKKTTIDNVELNVHDHLTENLSLSVGQATEAVTVESNASQVELQTPTSSGLITGTQIRELTLNTRNYESLVALQPGVSYGGTSDQIYVGATSPLGSANTVNFSINGSRNSANNWTIDGADNVDRGSNLTLLNYPSVDAIAEFKTIRNQYNAEFGRNASGMINVVTKSGTNGFHGDAYEFFRNDVLNANNVVNKQVTPHLVRPPLRYNNFGYTIGGPIKFSKGGEAKTFFFFSQEYRRVINYTNFTAEVPTAAQRAGTFAHPVCLTHSAAGACLTSGTQVSNINPIAQQYMTDIINKVPLPNGLGDANGLLRQARGVFNNRQDLVRIDHTFGPRLNVFYRYINDTFPTEEPGGLFLGNPLFEVSKTQTNSPGRTHLAHVLATLTPTLLVDGGYAYSYGGIIEKYTGLIDATKSPDIKAPNFFNLTLPRVPAVSFTTLSTITGNGPYNDFNRNHNVYGNLTKISGTHSLKFGATYNHYQKTENALGNGINIAGTYAFAGGARPAGGATTLEESFADFLTGFVPTYTQIGLIDLTPNMNTNQFETYAQDEWRVRRNLTLTMGVRWSLFPPPIDKGGELTTFDPSLYVAANAPTIDASGNACITPAGCPGPTGGTVFPNPTYNPLNGIAINGTTSRFGQKVAKTNYRNFAPRFGFAWDPWGDGKTSVRGGFGMAFDSSLFGIYEQNIFQNPPFFQQVTFLNTSFSNPAAGAVSGTTTLPALRGTDSDFRNPYTSQWSFDLQHEVGQGLMVDVGYFGSKGTHLLGVVDMNAPQPDAFLATLGNVYVSSNGSAQGTTPACTAVVKTNCFISTAQLNRIRPYVGYRAINSIASIFDSNYHSLQSSVQKRFNGGNIISGNYTWSKCLTDNQTDRSTAPQNVYNLRGDYGRCQLDRRHVFTASYVYDLPFLRQQQGFVGKTLGGWEVSGIFTANSGLPFSVSTLQNYDPAGLGVKEGTSVAGPRPNQIADPNVNAPHTLAQWFNTAAFQDVPLGTFLVGNSRRGSINGPGFWRMDASLFKNINIYESVKMQFRAEATNVFNHTNPATINTSLGNALFGKITAYREPRIMQLGLKLYF